MFVVVGIERLTEGLWYERQAPSVSVVHVGGSAAERSAVLRVRRAAMNGRRVHVDLVLLGGARTIDVSFHPAAAVDVVRGHARRRSSDGNGWLGALVPAVVADGARWSAWSPPAGLAAHAVLGGLAHPLVGVAYEAGVRAAAEVPRWASAALAEETASAAAVRLFGARSATRTVMAALGGFFVQQPAFAWWQLAAAVAAADVVEPDELAAILSARGPSVGLAPEGAAATAPAALAVDSAAAWAGEPVEVVPPSEAIAVLREGFRRLEHGRTRRLVVDAVVSAGGGGVRRLVRALRSLVDLADDVRWPPPARLAELEVVLLQASAVDPSPPPTRTMCGSAPAADRPTVPAPAATWSTPRRAPPTSGRPAPRGAFVHDVGARRRFDGVHLAGGELELVLPRTPQELTAWGRMLDNCLGDFAAAVAQGRSVIVGVRRRRALVAALELRPDLRTVVQFLGPRNRVPSATVTTPVLAAVERAAS
jgi:hypothetical protein